ncbi:DUF4124 domain-containing protein [Microbulbifer sp. SSSA002]|uniref:DUF4124 domain-containing protein n=1 Tax=unclassified Microbulbifer TaxID=2619833 RepID=UPI004039B33E
MRILLALLIAVTTTAAHADGIYKWVDEDGVVHFGEQPPGNTSVDVIQKPKSERYKKWEAEQEAITAHSTKAHISPVAPQAERSSAEEQQRQQQEAKAKAEAAAKRAELCSAYQKNLKSLTTHARVREKDKEGNYRRLGEDERQERIAKAREQIKKNC